jgi:hypothetical protein
MLIRGWGVWGLPGLRDEDHLCDFPLSWKVTVEQHSIEELGEILKAKGGQFGDLLVGRLVIIDCTSDRLRRVTGGSSWKGVSKSDERVVSGVELGSEGCGWNTEAR